MDDKYNVSSMGLTYDFIHNAAVANTDIKVK